MQIIIIIIMVIVVDLVVAIVIISVQWDKNGWIKEYVT